MQFLVKIRQIVGWRPSAIGLAHPPLGNSGSATGEGKSFTCMHCSSRNVDFRDVQKAQILTYYFGRFFPKFCMEMKCTKYFECSALANPGASPAQTTQFKWIFRKMKKKNTPTQGIGAFICGIISPYPAQYIK